ncbi:hypothetical protein BDZ94DRAFT_1266655 [Collybia nuda]|uniref:Uncharacterized protein n=1 Tax=Collybia nuda TaxID=64659 RepID=A0A9P5Y0J0_9AGAR|nr:hypothetical protein BDZ94DRAFT_1266655 [Collybia nuda]
MSNSTQIFNVPEAEGTDRVALETTAATAQIEAPTSSIAREVEANAGHTKEAASEAALTAQIKGESLTGTPPSAVDQFQQQAQKTTKAAVAEGQRDVETAKVTGATYLDQAKSLASNAVNTAQAYLPSSVGGILSSETSASQSPPTGIVSSLQSGANSAIGTTKEYLASAQEMAKPHVENAKGIAQGYLGTAGTQPIKNPPASSTGIPATSAPLESGPHTVNTPYSSTNTTNAKVGENSSH